MDFTHANTRNVEELCIKSFIEVYQKDTKFTYDLNTVNQA
jgi:hypothetical protein